MDPGQIFDRLDANGDGMLSHGEMAAMHQKMHHGMRHSGAHGSQTPRQEQNDPSEYTPTKQQ